MVGAAAFAPGRASFTPEKRRRLAAMVLLYRKPIKPPFPGDRVPFRRPRTQTVNAVFGRSHLARLVDPATDRPIPYLKRDTLILPNLNSFAVFPQRP
jgi:hypothetical protein